eukprot:scaffold207_cov409-Prasinococcus_capsulatus_cf.AAC.105
MTTASYPLGVKALKTTSSFIFRGMWIRCANRAQSPVSMCGFIVAPGPILHQQGTTKDNDAWLRTSIARMLTMLAQHTWRAVHAVYKARCLHPGHPQAGEGCHLSTLATRGIRSMPSHHYY